MSNSDPSKAARPERARAPTWSRLWMPRPSALRIAICLCGVGVVILSSIGGHVTWTHRLRAVSSGSPVYLGPDSAACRSLHSGNGVAKISGRVVADSFSGYPDVFQTSTGNKGIRMELASNGNAAVIVGARAATYGVMVSSQPMMLRARESFDLTLFSTGKADLSIGSGSVTAEFSDINPVCDALAVGVGYDSSRRLSGSAEVVFVNGSLTPFFPWQRVLGLTGYLLLIWIGMTTLAGDWPRRWERNGRQ